MRTIQGFVVAMGFLAILLGAMPLNEYFGYASQCGLLQPHARLASGCWSGSTGRAFHPQDSNERFQSCFLTSHPPFPSFAWRNHIVRGVEALVPSARRCSRPR